MLDLGQKHAYEDIVSCGLCVVNLPLECRQHLSVQTRTRFHTGTQYACFHRLGVLLVGVLIVGPLLFWCLCQGP